MFPKLPWTTLNLWWVKAGGQKMKRGREGYASEGDFLGILKDKWMKNRKRGNVWSIEVSSSKAWTGFIAKKGNLGNLDRNRLFYYLFLFNRDFQIFLPILF